MDLERTVLGFIVVQSIDWDGGRVEAGDEAQLYVIFRCGGKPATFAGLVNLPLRVSESKVRRAQLPALPLPTIKPP
jgi:hypothetical protein